MFGIVFITSKQLERLITMANKTVAEALAQIETITNTSAEAAENKAALAALKEQFLTEKTADDATDVGQDEKLAAQAQTIADQQTIIEALLNKLATAPAPAEPNPTPAPTEGEAQG